MSKQLINKIDDLVTRLDVVRQIALALPEANSETEYAIVNGNILIYIPYSLSILAEWQERLNKLHFVRADPFCMNEYGITEYPDNPRDSCRMVRSPARSDIQQTIYISLWLCPDHPKATIKKGSIPQL